MHLQQGCLWNGSFEEKGTRSAEGACRPTGASLGDGFCDVCEGQSMRQLVGTAELC